MEDIERTAGIPGGLVESSFALGALFLSILAMMFDLKTARVPNWLTGGGLIAGLSVRTCLAGGAGLETALAGALLGGGILLFPFSCVASEEAT